MRGQFQKERKKPCKRNRRGKLPGFIPGAGLWLALLISFSSLGGLPCRSQTSGKGREISSDHKLSSPDTTLASAQSAALGRHYSEAIRILRAGLREHPGDTALQLELGRTYLAIGEDEKAERLFREILEREPQNRPAQLELARALAYQRRYGESDALYQHLIEANPADEAAAIGLTSNLLHQGRPVEAAAVTEAALRYHSNSLRLLEYKDRIAEGFMGGEERAMPAVKNTCLTAVDYIDDSSGNHSWRVAESLRLRAGPGLTSDLHLEQAFLHSLDDPRELVQTFSEVIRWRPFERLAFSAGGGAIHFDQGDVRAIYETTLTVMPANHLLVGAGFSRIPIVPDAEAAEHELTAQGWDAFTVWTPDHWLINIRASRRHYTDENVAGQQWADAVHQWATPKMIYLAGYRFRHYGYSMDVAHGYFSPDSYQSHQATLGAVFRPNRKYRAEITSQAGAEQIASGANFQAAWEINARNQLTLGHWEFNLDYSRYHMAQVTGAFRADAGRFELAYHF